MPTPNWARFTLLLFVGASFVTTLLVGALGSGVARYAGIGTLMSFVVLVLFVIERWAWKWRGIRRLLRVPDLRGTWRIDLESGYAGDGGGTKTSYLVINQTYSTVTVEVLTDLGRSCSETSSLGKRGPQLFLAYIYRAQPEVIARAGNEPHRGAAELLIESALELRLQGDYWTDRKTFGTIRSTGWNKNKCVSFSTASAATFESHPAS
jgi:hypothetical protein